VLLIVLLLFMLLLLLLLLLAKGAAAGVGHGDTVCMQRFHQGDERGEADAQVAGNARIWSVCRDAADDALEVGSCEHGTHKGSIGDAHFSNECKR
jgi:hypothetical protein